MNLLEYAFGASPVDGGDRQYSGVKTATGRLALTFQRNTVAADLTITVQGADSLQGPWTDLARSTGGNATTVLAAGAVVTETGTGATRSVEVRDAFSLGQASHPRRFLRVKVSH